MKVQREVYTKQSPMNAEDRSIIGEINSVKSSRRHEFFQRAEFDLESNTIKASVSTKRMQGDPDAYVKADLNIPRFLHLLAHYNAGQRGMVGGYVIPEKNLTGSVKDQIEVFREDNRAMGERISSSYYESYLKGVETSFGEKNAKDTLKKEYGVKIKRQNGKELTEGDTQALNEVLSHTYKSIGNPNLLKGLAEKRNLKVSFSGSKNAFLRKAMGLYVPTESTVVVGPQMREVLPHEFAHFIDNSIGDEYSSKGLGRGYYSSEMHNTEIGKLASKGRVTFTKNKQTSSPYWKRSTEVFARIIEQYASINDGKTTYYSRPGYWSEKEFNKLKPDIEKVLSFHLGKSFKMMLRF
jgi:hypothetical protein